MNVEVVEESAAGPEETVEALDLPGQFVAVLWLGGGEAGADGAVHAIGSHRDDVADRAVADSLVQFLASVAVADHEADADFQILLVGLLRQVEHLLGLDAVGHERLFHEDVEAALDRVLEVQASGTRAAWP